MADDSTERVAVEPDRFWKWVDRRGDDECWPWTGQLSGPNKYGRITVGGRGRPATHVSLELDGRPMPFPGAMACHECDNPPCVNPKHLWWGTNKENMDDSVAKGRHPKTAKTHCRYGHPLSGENLVILGKGSKEHRWCRICLYASQAKTRAKRAVKARDAVLEEALAAVLALKEKWFCSGQDCSEFDHGRDEGIELALTAIRALK